MIEARTAAQILGDEYGLRGGLTQLPGEFDANFLVQAEGDGTRSILKIMHKGCATERVERQCAVLAHLGREASGFRHPEVLETIRGEPYMRVEIGGSSRIVWRLSYCTGTLLADYRPRTTELLASLGCLVAQLTTTLETLDLPEFEPEHPWRLTQALDVRTLLDAIEVPTRERVRTVLERFEQRTLEPLLALPHRVVYNDANDYNLLVGQTDPTDPRSAAVDGLFDFGDLCLQPPVCDLAIGMAYAILHQRDPLAAAGSVVRGFCETRALSDEEADLLFDLMSTRLAMSVAISSERQRSRPNEPYLAISRAPAEEALARLAEIRPEQARAFLRRAARLDAARGDSEVIDYLLDPATRFEPAVKIEGGECVLDLGSGSTMLGADPAAADLARLTGTIAREMARAGVEFAIGRWAESRAIYTASAFTGGRHPTAEARTHHLGLDVFCRPGTPIYAPFAGVVEIATINDAPLDYGGLVVLRHKAPSGRDFYTLYGHLSHDSVAQLGPGDEIQAGVELARLGDVQENGGWTPHLHIQIILDLLDLGADFPGVALEREAEFWRSLSPNPERLLGYAERRDFDGRPDLRPLRRRRADRLGSSLSLSYGEPLHVVRGFRQFLYDSHAQAYLDLYNNVPHVGHSHPRVVEAVQRQIALLNTNTRYLHDTILTYGERLAATLPEELSVCFFVNSGSEANELAIRLARAYTARRDLLVVEGAYHGHTTTLIDASPYKHDGPGGAGAPEWVHAVPNPDGFRGPWKSDDPDAGTRYASLVADELSRARDAGHPIAAYLSETYPSVAGQIVPPPGYVAAAYGHARAAGAVVIADEIQTGFGRLGDAFWGFEAQGAVPDIVVLGKPIANGFPMGAVVTTPEIAAAFDNGMEFFSTFGGNPVACAAALAVLDVVRDEGRQEHARTLGRRFLAELDTLRSDHSLVGDVRGQGFFLGLELVRDRETLEPADWEARYVVDRLRQYRILTGTDGIHHNVVKIRPSMAVEAADLKLAVEALRAILRETPLAGG